MTTWGLLVVAALATGGQASPLPAGPERAPEGPVLTVENLTMALTEIGAERDALRLALRAAQDEIARSRQSYAAKEAELADLSADLDSCLDIGDELQASIAVYDGLLTAERKAGKRQRWLTGVKFTLLGAAGGFVAAELTSD